MRSFEPRSIHTPANNPSSPNGSTSSATSTPICQGLACSSSAAVSGKARLVICDPKVVIVNDPHNLRKSALRNSPGAGRKSLNQRFMIASLFSPAALVAWHDAFASQKGSSARKQNGMTA